MYRVVAASTKDALLVYPRDALVVGHTGGDYLGQAAARRKDDAMVFPYGCRCVEPAGRCVVDGTVHATASGARLKVIP